MAVSQETCTLVLMGEFVLHEAIIRALSVKYGLRVWIHARQPF